MRLNACRRGLFVLNAATSAVAGEARDELGCRALLDTGADVSAISEAVAEKINADCVGTVEVNAAGGATFADVADVVIRFPSGLSALDGSPTYRVRALVLPLQDHDALVGMDIIAQWRQVVLSGRECAIDMG